MNQTADHDSDGVALFTLKAIIMILKIVAAFVALLVFLIFWTSNTLSLEEVMKANCSQLTSVEIIIGNERSSISAQEFAYLLRSAKPAGIALFNTRTVDMRLHGTFGRGGFLHGFYNPVSHELYISDDSNNDYINGYSISGFKIPVKNE